MLNKIYISGIVLLSLLLSSCIKDGVVECPEGNVRILLYAERFQNASEDPLADTESAFLDRINDIQYYLYRDGSLVQQNAVSNIASARSSGSPYYALNFNAVEYGNYQLVIVGNCVKKALSGNPVNINNLVLTYPGCTDTEDFFTAVFPFTVDSSEPATYDVGLSRVHGVVLYRFVNLPQNITAIGVNMDNVSNEKWIAGQYTARTRAEQRFTVIHPVADGRASLAESDFLMGTFPTLSGDKSVYYLSLFREDEAEPYSTLMISDTLNIRRNQLLEVVATFRSEYEVDFEINLDTRWDGYNPGGGISIQ